MDHHPPPPPPPSPRQIQPDHPHDPHNVVNAAPEPYPFSSTANHDREGAEESLPMKNFRALVFKFIKPFTPADESLIEQRLRDFFPAINRVPDHPPYSAMIKRALEELNAGRGSSEEAISEFIKNEYNNLPWAHPTILAHHLQNLSERGDIVMRCGQAYILRSAINSSPSHSPICSPSPSLSPNCSPCSTPSSSSCSSPSFSSCSSSSCSYSPRPSGRRLKRKRKGSQIQRRGRGRPRKCIQGRGWGGPRMKDEFDEEIHLEDEKFKRNSRGRGRPRKCIQGRGRGGPRMKDEIDEEIHLEDEKFKRKRKRMCIQKRGRGGSRKTIQGRGRGRPRKNVETPEGYQLREEQTYVAEEHGVIKEDNQPVELEDVIEDHNQVADMEVDETNKNNDVQGQKGQVVLEQSKAEELNLTIRSEPQERGAVEEWEKHQKQEKVLSEVLNQPEEQQNDGLQETEQAEAQIEVNTDQNQPSEQEYRVIAGQDQQEGLHSCTDDQQDVLIRSVAQADGLSEERNGQQKQEKGASIEQNQAEEQQDVRMILSEAQEDGNVEGLNLLRELGKRGSLEQNQSENQENDALHKQILPQKQLMDVIEEKVQQCEQQEKKILEKDKLQKQNVEGAEELHRREELRVEVFQEEIQLEEEVMEKQQDLVMIKGEAVGDGVIEKTTGQQKQVKGACMDQKEMEVQLDDVIGDQVQSQERCIEGAREKIQSCEQEENVEQDHLAKREAEGLHQQEEQQNEEILADEVVEEQQALEAIESEAEEGGDIEGWNWKREQGKGGSLDKNQSEEQENDALQEQILPQKQLLDVSEKKVQQCEQQENDLEQDQLQKQKFEVAEELHQQEELQIEVIQEEIELEVEVVEEQPGLAMIMGEVGEDGAVENSTGQQEQVKGAGVEQKELEDQLDDVIGEQVQPQEKCIKGAREKIQLYEQEEIAEQDHLAKQEAEGVHQLKEQQNEEILADEVVEEQQDVGTIKSEAEEGVSTEEWNGQHKEEKGETVEVNQLEEHENDVSEEQNQEQDQCTEGNKEKFQACELHQRIIMELKDKKELEVEIVDREQHQEEELKVEAFEKENQLQKYHVVSSESLQLCDVHSKDSTALPCKSFWSLMEEEKDKFLNNFRDQEMKSPSQGEEISDSSSTWALKLPELPLLESSPKLESMKEISSLHNQLVQARVQDEPLHPQFPISKLEPATTASALEVLPCKHMLQDHRSEGGSTELTIYAPCVEELPLSHHQNQGEKRRSVREGLRPRNRNVEAVAASENQHGQRQPVRRSPRHLKTNLEAAATTEGLDHSKERLKRPGIGRSTKLNIAATDRILRSGKNKKAGL